MLFLCRADVKDSGPTLEQHWVNASCLLGTLLFVVSQHDALNQCWLNVVPSSMTLLQH